MSLRVTISYRCKYDCYVKATHLERLVQRKGKRTFTWFSAIPAEVLRTVETGTGHVNPRVINL